MKRIKYSLIAGAILGVVCFIYFLAEAKINIGIVVGIFGFITFSIISYFRIFWRVKDNSKLEKIDKARIIYSGFANHLVNYIPVGGNLYLLSDKLIFQTNSINFIHKHEIKVDLDQIVEVDFINPIGIIKNILFIKTNCGKKEKFIVNNRQKWRKIILQKTK